MKAVILQSGYIPWLGYFDLINRADVFVFLDDAQWTTRDWRNRNRIRTPQGWKWLTVPVALEKPYYEYCIKDVKVDNTQNWPEQHLTTLKHHYKKTPHFEEVHLLLENALNKEHKFVVDLNYDIIFRTCDYLALDIPKFLFSQEMNIPNDIKRDDKLLEILRTVGGIDTYISG
ncbi:MAG TPA: WbqC family protein, partial [Anaerolineales bacterium]|nr:WbqC family protein [Anaerolineales bacterium]